MSDENRIGRDASERPVLFLRNKFNASPATVRLHALRPLGNDNIILSGTELIKAKFHYAIWFEAGSKLVGDQRPASNLSATSFKPASNHAAIA